MATQLSVLLAVSMFTWADETPQTVEQAARGYRIHVYESFRLQRSEFDRRHKAAKELEARWKAAQDFGNSDDYDAEVILKWYQDARNMSPNDALPEFPLAPQVAAPPRKEIKVSAPVIAPPNFLAPVGDQPDSKTELESTTKSADPELKSQPTTDTPMPVKEPATSGEPLTEKPAVAAPKPMDVVGVKADSELDSEVKEK